MVWNRHLSQLAAYAHKPLAAAETLTADEANAVGGKEDALADDAA